MLRLAYCCFALLHLFNCQRTQHSRRLPSSGADPDRTGDLLLAKQALSQLSYSPENFALQNFRPEPFTGEGLLILQSKSVAPRQCLGADFPLSGKSGPR